LIVNGLAQTPITYDDADADRAVRLRWVLGIIVINREDVPFAVEIR
jgi:hypothetical protein